jgi:hypothetical protein
MKKLPYIALRSSFGLLVLCAAGAGTIAAAPRVNAAASSSGENHDGPTRPDRNDHHPNNQGHHHEGHHSGTFRAGGNCETTFQFTGPTTIHIDGHCTLLHLGATTLVAEQTVTQNPDGTLGAVNDSVYTAANGDQLFSHFVGVAFPGAAGLDLSGSETFDGGTGRFRDVEGHTVLQGTVQFTSPSSGIGRYTVSGIFDFS